MIEKIILDYLNDKLECQCYMEKPVNPPEKYVLIERTGGGISNHVIATGTFAVQSHAESLFDACKLNENVMDTVIGLVENDSINYVVIDGFYNFTDTATKSYRYQTVVRIGYYMMED